MKRVLVCGSRDWEERTLIRMDIAWVASQWPGATVIHGGARGADAIAGQIAQDMGLNVEVFPADWDAHGKRAGILRNLAMLDTNPTHVIAFQKGRSRGTQHTIDEAQRRGIWTKVWMVEDDYSMFHIEYSEPIKGVA
jgi:hypothetical protein